MPPAQEWRVVSVAHASLFTPMGSRCDHTLHTYILLPPSIGKESPHSYLHYGILQYFARARVSQRAPDAHHHIPVLLQRPADLVPRVC